METLSEILDALRRPLDMAARDGHARIGRIRGLERTIPALAEQGAARARSAQARAALGELASTFAGYAVLDPDARRAAVDQGLVLLERARQAGESAPAAAPDALRVPITRFRGVGEEIAGKLARLGIRTAWDALWTLPRTYEERLPPRPVRAIRQNTIATLDARVLSLTPPRRARSGLRIFEAIFEDETGTIPAVWYNFVPRLSPGQRVRVVGPVEAVRGRRRFRVPEIIYLRAGEQAPDDPDLGRIVPVYPLTEGLGERRLRSLLRQVVDEVAPRAPELIPGAIIRELGLPPLAEALRTVHFPPPGADLHALEKGATPAHRRLAFEELFFLELHLALVRRDIARAPASACPGGGRLERRLFDRLPFALTGAQRRALREIGTDLARPHPMNRLLQGDVGSGKTVVALLAAARAIDAGAQAAIMAPTEILAEQHFRTIEPLLSAAGARAALLTAGVSKAERARTLRGVAEGAIGLLVGTHAVIVDAVRFARLAFAVVDEQHRFGVAQRMALREKGTRPDSAEEPHLLVMTATPIPRSLALTVFGDLDLSVIDEMPPGREPVETRHFTEKDRRKVYAQIRETAGAGRQVFVVYPLVSESEKVDLRDATRMAEALRMEFSDLEVGLVHGQMKPAEKNAVMARFKRGAIHVLVATTVVEVGIDVPNATLMVVEHAERFGLSQLHQLRGRVGRGGGRSRCHLLTPPLAPGSEAARRMRVMEATQDGFRIAEEDLAIRGPGDFLGTRQHGLPNLRVASLLGQAPLISRAREAAQALVASEPSLSKPEHVPLWAGLDLHREALGLLRAG